MLSDQRAIYVDGIGHLDQYGSYIDTLWEKGVVYFVRDYYLRQPATPSVLRRLHALNSDIQEWEQNGGRVECDDARLMG